MEVRLKTPSRLIQDFFKTILRLIKFNWTSTQLNSIWTQTLSLALLSSSLLSYYHTERGGEQHSTIMDFQTNMVKIRAHTQAHKERMFACVTKRLHTSLENQYYYIIMNSLRSGLSLHIYLQNITDVIPSFIFAKLSSSRPLKFQLNWDSIITKCLPPDPTRP